jgi:LmbE family N-acetylglucosaminyl deacetylase
MMALIRKYSMKRGVALTYLICCIAILLGTTVLWSLLGATLQQSNADQLVNPYLYQSSATWHGIELPDQHTFLIKWPLFYLVKALGYSATAYEVVTVLTVILTVALFAWLLSRIERRPIVLGTILLALSSVLLLVPAQPYAGGLLPVNMAMLATRNLEYVVYIAGLYFVIKGRYRNWRFWAGVGLLGLLIASDKLFLSVSIVAALLALIAYCFRQRWAWVTMSTRWLTGAVGALLLAMGIIGIINHGHIAHVVTHAVAGPYSVVHDKKSVALGVIYAVGGVLTNFGANPAYDASTLRQIPSKAMDHLVTLAGPAYVVNCLLVLFATVLALRFLMNSLGLRGGTKTEATLSAGQLAVALLWSAVAVVVLFVVTNHYYFVDSRYLALWLFSLFVTVAVWGRSQQRLRPEPLALLGVVLLLSIGSGVSGSIQTHFDQQTALEGISQRNEIVGQTLRGHRVKQLVGDYWRVVPVKAAMSGRQEVTPLDGCTKPRDVLTSTAWQPDLRHESFAYLLTLNGSLTDFPSCNLAQVTAEYGLPNSSVLITGTLAHPDEVLLFYDHGSHPLKAASDKQKAQAAAAILPINLEDLTHTNCQLPTVMNVVAHQDDDLLFMNPDLIHDIKAGHCIRTVYLTAGDAGNELPYWLSREQGAEAAYGEMLGNKPVWTQQIVKLPSGQFVTMDSPNDNRHISLIFMHLPDGNVHGDGFGKSHHESLSSLLEGRLSTIHTIDQQSSYSSDQLVRALTDLMHTYLPSEIRTQSNDVGSAYPDHADHLATGQFATKAYAQYETEQFNNEVTVPLGYYMGYPIHSLDPNVVGQDLDDKTAAFMAYAALDGSVCHSKHECDVASVYGVYINRQYASPY